MNIEEIINITKEPLDNIVDQKMEHRDYRKIRSKNPLQYSDLYDWNYDLLLWYSNTNDFSISIKITESEIRFILSENSNNLIDWFIDKENLKPIILKYFIHGCEVHKNYKDRINNFSLDNIPKEFIREERLNNLLD